MKLESLRHKPEFCHWHCSVLRYVFPMSLFSPLVSFLLWVSPFKSLSGKTNSHLVEYFWTHHRGDAHRNPSVMESSLLFFVCIFLNWKWITLYWKCMYFLPLYGNKTDFNGNFTRLKTEDYTIWPWVLFFLVIIPTVCLLHGNTKYIKDLLSKLILIIWPLHTGF